MDQEAARDAVNEAFYSHWMAEAAAAAGLTSFPKVEFTGLQEDQKLSEGNAPWARVTVKWASGQGHTLAPVGSRRFDRRGTVTVQVFTPVGKRGLLQSDRLAKVAQDAFEANAPASGPWFRNVRPQDVGPDGAWYQVNVVAEFTFDEVK